MFYIGLDANLMAVPVRMLPDGHAVEVGEPVALFATHIGGASQPRSKQQYVVSPDGQRFLMNFFVDDAISTMRLIVNWKRNPSS